MLIPSADRSSAFQNLSPMTTHFRAGLRRFLPLLALFAAACADRHPASVETDPPAAPGEALARLECTARVAAGTLTCAPAAPSTGGARADVVLGSPYVDLVSFNVSYDGSSVFQADVVVHNRTPQPIGTADGTTPSAEGVRVFFHSGPVVTAGSGTVEVANADGVDLFLSSGQPFFRYAQLLQPDEASDAKNWRFTVPNTVQSFTFVVYVSTEVPRPDGWVDLHPDSAEVMVGGSHPLVATQLSAGGGVVSGGPVAWTTSDASVATVSASGVVTGVAPGIVTVTAASGARTGTARVRVTAADQAAPTLLAMSISPDTVDVSAGSQAVGFTFRVADGGSGVDSVRVEVIGPPNRPRERCAAVRVAGTDADGTWTCSISFVPGAFNGTWEVASVTLRDHAGYRGQAVDFHFRTGRMETSFVVKGSTEDVTAPSLMGLTLAPAGVSVADSAATVTFTVTGTDAGVGLRDGSVELMSPIRKFRFCELALVEGTAASGTLRCSVTFPRGEEGGEWQVSYVRLRDRNWTSRTWTRSELQAFGYPTTVTVASPTSDTTPPEITSVAVTPDTASNATEHALFEFTIGVADAGGGEVSSVSVSLSSPPDVFGFVSPYFSWSCTRVAGTAAAGTWRCDTGVTKGDTPGAYAISRVTAVDAVGNGTDLRQADLQARGLPHEVVVTN